MLSRLHTASFVRLSAYQQTVLHPELNFCRIKKKKHARKNKYLGISEFSVVCQEIPGTVFSKVKCNIAGMVGLSISAKKDVSLHM